MLYRAPAIEFVYFYDAIMRWLSKYGSSTKEVIVWVIFLDHIIHASYTTCYRRRVPDNEKPWHFKTWPMPNSHIFRPKVPNCGAIFPVIGFKAKNPISPRESVALYERQDRVECVR